MLDLTHQLTDDMPLWPGDPSTVIQSISQEPCSLNYLSFGEHSGTHLGAPAHYGFAAGITDFPLELMVGTALFIHCESHADRPIEQLQLEEALRAIDDRLAGQYSLVVVVTGWARLWPSDIYFTGGDLDSPTAPTLLPAGLSPTGLHYLLNRFSPQIVGIDSPNIDFGGAALGNLECGIELARRGLYHLENIASVPPGLLSEVDYLLMPLNIRGATGSPVRFVVFDSAF